MLNSTYDSNDIYECFAKDCKHRGPARLSNQPPFAQCGACGSAEVAPLNYDGPPDNDGEPEAGFRERTRNITAR